MTAAGIEPAAGKGFQRFFRGWGSKANIRGVWNTILPVAVVDRFYGDEAGSYQAITAFRAPSGFPGEFPAIIFGSTDPDVDVNLHALKLWNTESSLGAQGAANAPNATFLYTPVAGYDPVLNLAPVGFFDSGLILTPNFTRGAVVALAGSNPALPTESFGLTYAAQGSFTQAYRGGVFVPSGNVNPGSNDERWVGWMHFDPPMRLPGDVVLACQWNYNGSTAAVIPQMWGTFLYTERRLA